MPKPITKRNLPVCSCGDPKPAVTKYGYCFKCGRKRETSSEPITLKVFCSNMIDSDLILFVSQYAALVHAGYQTEADTLQTFYLNPTLYWPR